jgi:hypothetical protein
MLTTFRAHIPLADGEIIVVYVATASSSSNGFLPAPLTESPGPEPGPEYHHTTTASKQSPRVFYIANKHKISTLTQLEHSGKHRVHPGHSGSKNIALEFMTVASGCVNYS